MSKEISLFSTYRQKENTVTNYCGLIMKLIYEESPRMFEELLAALIQGDADLSVGPIFRQQHKMEKSIPDLSITQKPFSVFFENKLSDWFYDSQITKHINSFGDHQTTKVLFLLANFEIDNYEDRFQNQIQQAKEGGVILQPLSYEDFIAALENLDIDGYLENVLEEFKAYLDGQGLLPKWKYLLDVVSCSGTMHEIEAGAYMCPDKGGAYCHRRARFFGPYSNKGVRTIHEIEAVVSVDQGGENATIKWNNTGKPEKQLKERAIAQIKKYGYRLEENGRIPLQVFLLGEGQPTTFIKSSDGGMMQSKLYFWNIAKQCNSSKELAEELRNKTWEDYR